VLIFQETHLVTVVQVVNSTTSNEWLNDERVLRRDHHFAAEGAVNDTFGICNLFLAGSGRLVRQELGRVQTDDLNFALVSEDKGTFGNTDSLPGSRGEFVDWFGLLLQIPRFGFFPSLL